MIDKQSRNKLVEKYYNYAMRISHKYINIIQDEADRHSIAAEALMQAVDTYNPNRKSDIKTHIWVCVRNKMLNAYKKIKKERRNMGVIYSMDAVRHINGKGNDDCQSLYDITPSSSKNPIDILIENENRNDLLGAINNLPKIQREILMARYLKPDPMTQEAIAHKYNRHQYWTSRQEQRGLQACKKSMCISSEQKWYKGVEQASI